MADVVNIFTKEQYKITAHTEKNQLMDSKAFAESILRPAYKMCGLWSIAAEVLMLNTARAESGLQYLTQFENGPALSFFQIEPKTYIDVLRYLGKKSELKDKILSCCYLDIFPDSPALIWNMRLAALVARVKYWMVPEPLPEHTDIVGQAKYWKKYYNTTLGDGTGEHFMRKARRFNDYA